MTNLQCSPSSFGQISGGASRPCRLSDSIIRFLPPNVSIRLVVEKSVPVLTKQCLLHFHNPSSVHSTIFKRRSAFFKRTFVTKLHPVGTCLDSLLFLKIEYYSDSLIHINGSIQYIVFSYESISKETFEFFLSTSIKHLNISSRYSCSAGRKETNNIIT